jgi:hypothetical protein
MMRADVKKMDVTFSAHHLFSTHLFSTFSAHVKKMDVTFSAHHLFSTHLFSTLFSTLTNRSSSIKNQRLTNPLRAPAHSDVSTHPKRV